MSNDGHNWRSQISSIVQANPVEHEVNGHKVKFFPISVNMLVKLRLLGRPLAQAIGALLSKTTDDTGAEQTHSDDTTVDVVDDVDKDGHPIKRRVLVGVTGTNTKRDPLSVEMAQFRADQKERAIDRIVDAFTDQGNLRVLAAMVFDSCREIFPRKPSEGDLDEFLAEFANTSVMGQFLAGLMKANTKSLGKLGEQLTESVAKVVRTRISEVDADAETGPTMTSSRTDDASPQATAPPVPPAPPAPPTTPPSA